MELPKKIKRILFDPSPKLRLVNEPVDEPWMYLEKWVAQMFTLMYESPSGGVGLSACQVGWNVQLFVMNADKEKKSREKQRVFWNPKIFGTMGEVKKVREGCLSLPNVFGLVERFPGVVLHAITPTGPIVEPFEGFAAQIIQHEMDHLAGKVCWEKFVPPDPAPVAPPAAEVKP